MNRLPARPRLRAARWSATAVATVAAVVALLTSPVAAETSSGVHHSQPARKAADIAAKTRAHPACGRHHRVRAEGHRLVCTFDDEFDKSTGDAHQLDRRRWLQQRTSVSGYTTGSDNHKACYVASRRVISVHHGKLRLSARQLRHPMLCHSHASLRWLTHYTGGFTTSYIAGMVSTFRRFSQTYGQFEVRAKLPAGTTQAPGLQETFWLWPVDDLKYGGRGMSGEVDFAEFYSRYPRLMIPFIHYAVNPLAHRLQSHTNVVTAKCRINPRRYNTYAAEWQPGRLTFRVNGRVCLVDNYQALGFAAPAPFDAPFFPILTQALGERSNRFVPGKTVLPATTKVDYVRIWGSR